MSHNFSNILSTSVPYCLHLSLIYPTNLPRLSPYARGFFMTQYTLSHVPCLFLSSVPYKLSHITHTECRVFFPWFMRGRLMAYLLTVDGRRDDRDETVWPRLTHPHHPRHIGLPQKERERSNLESRVTVASITALVLPSLHLCSLSSGPFRGRISHTVNPPPSDLFTISVTLEIVKLSYENYNFSKWQSVYVEVLRFTRSTCLANLRGTA